MSSRGIKQRKVSDDENQRRVATIEAALREGYPPPGKPAPPGHHGAVQEAANRLGVAVGTLNHALRHGTIVVDWGAYNPASIDDGGASELVRLRERVKVLESQALSVEMVRGLIGEFRAADKPLPRWSATPKRGKKNPLVPVALWSDWHWNERVDGAQINHVNSYDLQIAHARVQRLVSTTIELCRHYTVADDIPGIVVCLGGDMYSGNIHEELRRTNEIATMPGLLDLYGAIKKALLALADEFGRVMVHCVAGNHGRLDTKPVYKNAAAPGFSRPLE